MAQFRVDPRLGASDTPPEIEAERIARYRTMSAREKIRCVLDLNLAAETLASARIRRQYGSGIPAPELALRLAALRLDRDTMIEAFGWDPEEKGY